MRFALACLLLAACSPPVTFPDAADSSPIGDGAPDVQGDVPGLDVATDDASADAPAVDVRHDDARDAGSDTAPDAPADAPPDAPRVFPDLETNYPSEMFSALYAPCTEREGCVGERSAVTAPTNCRVMRVARTANFGLRVCNPIDLACDDLSGLVGIGAGAPSSTVSVRDAAGQTGIATAVTVTAGARYFVGTTPRQNLHVQFAVSAMGVRPGATGIAGRTVAPDRGDVWLLGCLTD